MFNIRDIIFIRAYKVGGLRFLKIGRIQFSVCVCKSDPWEAERERISREERASIRRTLKQLRTAR